ncbi:hypothetical protein JEQ12_016283 [Ovis aries]|uniref:SCAN box domain-containing protein n=1 Tax=Ovis aries TaxID=9940 RepID=A0A836D2U0_SHEEP|nr:hypothetical protein JEQ12_016283 [Ovis aries]
METEGCPEMQRDEDFSGEVQNDEIRSPPNERMAEEPEGIPIAPSPLNPAASRQRFWEFHYEDAAGPRDQLVEMLVQEQFQAVLPEELRAWALRCQPGVRITG